MDQIELFKKVLEAAGQAEDDMAEDYEARQKPRIASEHFHRAGGIKYALDLMKDPHYLRAQAEILGVLPDSRPAKRDIDAETAQILEIERELKRPKVYQPRIEAMRQKGIG